MPSHRSDLDCPASLDALRTLAKLAFMLIRNVRHRGLRRLIDADDTSGLQAAVIDKLRKMISFLQDMDDEAELRCVQSWKPHQLTGDLKGSWSLFVTKNWRLTFRIDPTDLEIVDLNLVDYH